MATATTYLTRHRMEIGLDRLPTVPALPDQYVWVPWDAKLLDVFAEVHFLSFRHTLDAKLFRSFGNRPGCWHLINEIRNKTGFLPGATWLIAGPGGCCATIEGCVVGPLEGCIQNVAVLPAYRRLGFGRALVLQSLHGFAGQGVDRVSLEVTAENGPAYLLYQRLGFRKIHTSYKEILVDEP
jgi:ribosomal protein S18 acetylase RimI-like enzyme